MSEKILRSKQVMLRFSEKEFAKLGQLHGADKALAVALREYVLGLPVPEKITEKLYKENKRERPPHFAPIDPAFMRQIAGAMSNINQIAKLANTHKNEIEKLQIVAALANIENQLNQLLEIGYDLSETKP